jgi:2-C-methyl-D-erythritol 4-phosphate cytidylyltransferase/2-C-methyl-D-erythritol 2,4-cyclodiphosphate synthase
LSGTVRADAIVVAAGRSARMEGVDKLAASVHGRPVLAWALAAVAASPEVERLVVVAAPELVAGLERASWLPDRVSAVVSGGARRQDSVRAGFDALPAPSDGSDPVILVHDGARPAVSSALVSAVARAAAAFGAAIPVVPVAETLKRVVGDRVVETVDRSELATAQTPQGVRRSVLEKAWSLYPASASTTFTDEASLLEACRIDVHVLPGEPGNLKVTVPHDLDRAAAALSRGSGPAAPAGAIRVGFGTDSHPFGPGGPLVLGGIELAGAPRLHGHSDGDVVLHAVADALLGATGLGDLGRLFPADARTPRGIASTELLRDVVGRVRGAGFRPASVDVTIVAARPRLAGGLDPMRDALTGLLGLGPGAVGVKASTGNLAGMEGAGRGITAHAAVTVVASS